MKVMKATYQIGTGLVLLVAFLLSACSSDDSNDKNGSGRQMHISLASSVYQNDGGVTRSLPMGYVVLNVETAFPSGKDLLAFIANSTNTSEVLIRRLEYVNDWQQNISVTDYTNPYCIYGFVPHLRRYVRQCLDQPVNWQDQLCGWGEDDHQQPEAHDAQRPLCHRRSQKVGNRP